LLTLTKPHTAFVVQQNGNVGINRKVATEKLDIVGSIKIEDGTQGAGKVLTSDANGKASWQTAAAGGGATDSSQLQKITEAGNTGWRILGRDSANYGNIGSGSIDLSLSSSVSTTKGATGPSATAMGLNTTASGSNSIAMGQLNSASGGNSTAMGQLTSASGTASTAMGSITIASGFAAIATGSNTTASGIITTAMGDNTKAKSYGELAVGIYNDTLSSVSNSNSNDSNRVFTVGNGDASARKTAFVVQQNGNVGINRKVATEKLDIVGSIKIEDGTQGAGKVLTSDANGKASWQTAAGGGATDSSQLQKITEGGSTGWRILGRDTANFGNIGSGAIDFSLSSLPSTTKGATGPYSVAMGINSTASGQNSTASGQGTIASGGFSTAMGQNTIASGIASTSTGTNTTASGNHSSAMGFGSNAAGSASTAMGNATYASGDRSLAMGDLTTASGFGSTALGSSSTASGQYSTAMGFSTRASGIVSTAMGYATKAKSYGETAIGIFNDTLTTVNDNSWAGDQNRVFTVGAGSSDATRKSVFVIEQNGSVKIGPNGSKNKNVFSATTSIGSNGAQKKTITVAHGKTFTGTQVITATVANEPGTTNADVYCVSITEITSTSFKAVIYRVDGTSWGQNPVLHYTITEQ
jgi:hypothetical protein